jgi:hypothetical protein
MGQVFRDRLLLNNQGKPYSNKASLSKIFARIGFVEKKTPWGMAKTISEKQIKEWNKQW